MTVGELCKNSGDKTIVFRCIRNSELVKPRLDQLNDFWSKWSPGAVETGKYLIVDVEELP